MQHQHDNCSLVPVVFWSADPEVLYLHAKACFDCDHKDNLGGFNIQTYLEMLQVQNARDKRTICYTPEFWAFHALLTPCRRFFSPFLSSLFFAAPKDLFERSLCCTKTTTTLCQHALINIVALNPTDLEVLPVARAIIYFSRSNTHRRMNPAYTAVLPHVIITTDRVWRVTSFVVVRLDYQLQH